MKCEEFDWYWSYQGVVIMTKEEFCKELKESQERGILAVCSTAQKYINSLEAENEKLKKEVANYHQLQWQHDALIDENEKLERELKQTEVQDQVVIDGLRNENERLKAEIDREEKLMDSWGIEGLTTITETNRNLSAENAELKCLALHLMSEYCFAQGTIIQIQLEFASQPIEEDVKMIHKVNIRDRWGEYFAEAYRKAKGN